MKDKTKYQKVYFRIEAGYVWSKGLETDRYIEIEAELAKIFKPLGFQEKPDRMSCAAPEYIRGKENLYCHPMSFSGYLAVENIPVIEAILKEAKTFSLTSTDRYDEAYNYAPEELSTEIASRKEAIQQEILAIYKTKRRNLFRSRSELNRIKLNVPCFDTCENRSIKDSYIIQVFNELVQNKALIESENYKIGKIYRTAS